MAVDGLRIGGCRARSGKPMAPPEKLRFRAPDLDSRPAELGVVDAAGDAGSDLSNLRNGITLLGESAISLCTGGSTRPSSTIDVRFLGSQGSAVTLGGSDKLLIGVLTCVRSEQGSLHNVSDDDDGASSRRCISGEEVPMLSGLDDCSFSPTLWTLSAASSERMLTYEAGIQPPWDPSLRTAAHHPDSSCLTIARTSSFRNENSGDEKSYRQMTEQIRSKYSPDGVS
jgi:hypothetical protein